MSDGIKHMYERIDHYIWLCEKYNEEPETDAQGVNPYCDHAYALEARWRNELKSKRNATA